MIITRAVIIYYRVSDGLLSIGCPNDEMLKWVPLKVWLSFKGNVDLQSGLIVNVSHIKRAVRQSLDGNSVKCQSQQEIIKWFIATFDNYFDSCVLSLVKLAVGGVDLIVNTENEDMLILTKKYEMAASHRLWNDQWSEERNYQEFGKCANPNGHGHNYLLEVSVEHSVDGIEGRSMDPDNIDAIVDEYVVEKFDHKNLCIDIPELKGKIPTVEMMSIAVWDILKDKFTYGRLANVKIWETQNTFAEYSGC